MREIRTSGSTRGQCATAWGRPLTVLLYRLKMFFAFAPYASQRSANSVRFGPGAGLASGLREHAAEKSRKSHRRLSAFIRCARPSLADLVR